MSVLDGGGDILPTERNHISRREAREGYRLSCQVAVKQNMRDRSPRRGLRNQAVGLHGPLEPQRGHVHQGTGARTARRRRRGLQAGRIHPDRSPAASCEVRRLSRSSNSSARIGTNTTCGDTSRDVDEPVVPRVLDGQLPGRKGHHHAQRPRGHAAAPRAGTPAR